MRKEPLADPIRVTQLDGRDALFKLATAWRSSSSPTSNGRVAAPTALPGVTRTTTAPEAPADRARRQLRVGRLPS